MPEIYKPKKKREYNDYSGKRKKRQDVYNTTRWRNIRKAKLMKDPLCEICLLEGRTTLAEDVHHLCSFVDYADNQALTLAFDSNNLCSVCKHCHWRCHNGDLQGTTSLEDIKNLVSQEDSKDD